MVSQFFEWLFDSSGLTPHGYCLLWEPGLIWGYAAADAVTGIAYFSIPIALIEIAFRRRDLIFRPLLWLFAAFIVLCGVTHWLDVVTLWLPWYGFQITIKIATALVSIGVAFVLMRSLPALLALPSPVQFQQATSALKESQEQLFQAQKMEAVGRLTGGLAHDFNNLIQVVAGSVTMIEKRLAAGRQNDIDRFLAAIRQSIDTAARVTNRLLAFSRRQALQPRAVSPSNLIGGMSDLLRHTLGPEISFTVNPHADQDAYCDPHQLESAILNLCINARDAMPNGGQLVLASRDRIIDADEGAASEIEPGCYVEFVVSDTGTGMDEETLRRACEPFYTTKPLGQGTGLGLSQVYGFARQSGGALQLRSAPGDGTTVSLLIPARASDARTQGEEQRKFEVAEKARPERLGVVLVVDDEAEIRRQLGDTLAEKGWTVQEAVDGRAALALLEGGLKAEVLVTDIGMHGVNGRLLSELARGILPDLPVLFITGYAGEALQALPARSALLRKPFQLEELHAAIEDLLAKTRVVTQDSRSSRNRQP